MTRGVNTACRLCCDVRRRTATGLFRLRQQGRPFFFVCSGGFAAGTNERFSIVHDLRGNTAIAAEFASATLFFRFWPQAARNERNVNFHAAAGEKASMA
jgi:hypothetical protein